MGVGGSGDVSQTSNRISAATLRFPVFPPTTLLAQMAELTAIINEIFGDNATKVADWLTKNGVKSAEDCGLMASSEEEVVSSIINKFPKKQAPAYFISLFEEHLKGKGMGLHELAVFAATIADLVHAEAIGLLGQIYNALDLPTAGQVVPNHATLAVSHFIRAHLLDCGVTIENHQDLVAMKARLEYQYPNQEDTNMWVWDLQETYNLEQ